MKPIDAFRGYNQPVMVDNFVITETCEGYIRTIRDYREINQRMVGEVERIEKAFAKLEGIPFWIRLFKPLYRRAIKKAYEKGRS
jgi:AAA+ ATPase superfamily predicted ATPase